MNQNTNNRLLAEPYDLLRKKLIYLSRNRGCKETELIFAAFTEKYLKLMDISELKDFEILLNQADADIYDWISKKSSPPKIFQTDILNKLLNDKN